MVLARITRQAYRLYAIATLLWAVLSLGWLAGIGLPATTLGYGWLAVAALGSLVAVAMVGLRVRSEYRLFRRSDRRERIRRFENLVLSGAPLHLYVVAVAAWSFLTLEWVVVELGVVGTTLLGYGWVLVAVYGLAVALGLSKRHSQDIAETADEVTPRTVDLDPG